jgi:hypothetical protein
MRPKIGKGRFPPQGMKYFRNRPPSQDEIPAQLPQRVIQGPQGFIQKNQMR